MKNISHELQAQKTSEEQWKKAIDNDDSHALLELIDQGFKVNQPDQNKQTPLHYAAIKGSLEAVKILMENGAQVTGSGLLGFTPAYYAIMNYNVETNCQGKHLEVLRYLLKMKCDPNYGFNKMPSPCFRISLLEMAIIKRHSLAVKLLLEEFATYKKEMLVLNEDKDDNFSKPIRDLLTPHLPPEQAFEVAVREGNRDRVIELIMEKVNVNQLLSLSKKPALYVAAQKGDLEMVQLLIENGAKITVNSVTFNTNRNRKIIDLFQEHLTPQEVFNVAAFELSYNEVISLALAGDEVEINNSVDTQGNKFVHILAQKGKPDDIKNLLGMLMPNKMELNAKNNQGETALHMASRREGANAQAAVQELLAQGININIMDNERETALYQAIRANNEGIIRLLLEKGAKPLTKQDLRAVWPNEAEVYTKIESEVLNAKAQQSDNQGGDVAYLLEDDGSDKVEGELLGGDETDMDAID